MNDAVRRGGAGRRGGGRGRAGSRAAGISLADLRRRLAAGKIERVYLCLGEEPWLQRAAVAAIEAVVITDRNREWGKEEIEAGEAGARDILRAATAAPMLGGRQLIEVRAVERLRKPDKESFPAALARIPETTVLVMTAAGLDGRTTFARELKRRAVVVDCGPLAEGLVPRWIRSRLAAGGRAAAASDAAIARLHLLVGGDLGSLEGEIEKLIQFAGAERRIEVEDVDRVAAGGSGASLADLVGALGNRDVVAALRALATVLEAGHHPLEVLAFLGYRLHDLWRAQDDRGPGGGWFRPEVRVQAGNFEPRELRRAAVLLFEADRRLKTSHGEPRLVLESLIRQLAARPLLQPIASHGDPK